MPCTSGCRHESAGLLPRDLVSMTSGNFLLFGCFALHACKRGQGGGKVGPERAVGLLGFKSQSGVGATTQDMTGPPSLLKSLPWFPPVFLSKSSLRASPAACGILVPRLGMEPVLPAMEVDSYPLDCQASLHFFFIELYFT